MAMTKNRSSGDEIPAPLEKVLGQPGVASEFFFPIDRAAWRERVAQVLPQERRPRRSPIDDRWRPVPVQRPGRARHQRGDGLPA